jgi:drug/metabolite transporter (DMT)-like permease
VSVDVADVRALGRERRRGQLYIVLAALAWSTAGLLQRELSMDTATQVAGRALFALLALLAFVALQSRGDVVGAFRSIGRAGLAFALAMAVASGSFIVALNETTVANVLFLQALAPVAAATLAGVVLGERVSRRTWIAMVLALGGVAVMIGGPSSEGIRGQAIALLMTLAFAVTVVIARRSREISMAPATALSQLIVLAVAAPLATPSQVGAGDLGLLVLLGAGQMGLGLTFLTLGARLIPAAEVALITLLEVVLGPLWVWLAISEEPGTATLVGGAVVVAAVVIQTSSWASGGRRRAGPLLERSGP